MQFLTVNKGILLTNQAESNKSKVFWASQCKTEHTHRNYAMAVRNKTVCFKYQSWYTYSMEHSPSWEANWFAVSQEIPRISRNPKFHHRIHKCPPSVPILSQLHPVSTPSHFSKITELIYLWQFFFCLRNKKKSTELIKVSEMGPVTPVQVRSKPTPHSPTRQTTTVQ